MGDCVGSMVGALVGFKEGLRETNPLGVGEIVRLDFNVGDGVANCVGEALGGEATQATTASVPGPCSRRIKLEISSPNNMPMIKNHSNVRYFRVGSILLRFDYLLFFFIVVVVIVVVLTCY